MPRRANGLRPEVVAAIITVIGGIVVAFIANFDKFSSRQEPGSHETPAILKPESNLPQKPEADPAEPGKPDQIVAPSIAGTWQGDLDKTHVQIRQHGANYTYVRRRSSFSSSVENGRGKINGAAIGHYFAGESGEGNCIGEIKFATKTGKAVVIRGTCNNGAVSFPFQFSR
jgi:hypothetical protein